MPTTYTHYAYGQDVFKKLPEQIQKSIEPYMDYYNIGVHGPDILFYYHSYHKNSVNQYGIKVHHEPAREFFKRAFKVFQVQKNKRAACAYLAGFMTHFILDSTDKRNRNQSYRNRNRLGFSGFTESRRGFRLL